MFGSVVLDLAIGMAFVYLLLSLVASVVQEMLSTFMQLRSANLQKAIRSLVSGGSIPGVGNLVDEIYNHGLVRGLYSDPNIDSAIAAPATRGQKFWAGVKRWDWLRSFLRRTIGIHPENPIAGVSNQMLLPAYIPAPTFALTLSDLLNPTGATGKEAMAAIRDLLAKSNAQGSTPVAQALLALAREAQDDLAKFQASLESWYNAAMDRASGWYKKYTQTILLVIGLVLAVTFNVDSIRVARALWTDKDVRQGMVNAASEYSKAHPNAPAQAAATGSDNKAFTRADLQKQLQDTADEFNHAATKNLLPVGWKEPEVWMRRRHNLRIHPLVSIGNGLGWLTYSYTWQLMLGWFMTGIAISMGAPFWFDMLNKFMVVRGTVKPAEKSAPEGSKDRPAPPPPSPPPPQVAQPPQAPPGQEQVV